jgi:hypothetical protein
VLFSFARLSAKPKTLTREEGMAVSARPKSSVFLIALLAGASSLGAQNVDSLKNIYLLPVPPTVIRAAAAAASRSRETPGSSAQSPTAYGADFGDGYIGAGFQGRMRYVGDAPLSKRMDGAVFAGFGLGNSDDNVGFEGDITSFSTIRSGFGHHSTFSFKFHRNLPRNFAVAAGWEDAIRTKGLDGGTSLYGVVSTAYKRVTVSAGLGGGRFRTESNIDNGIHRVNAFGSVGVHVAEPVSLIADWAGQDLALAASIVPFAGLPLFVLPGVVDVTGSAGDGARFILGVGLGFRFAQVRSMVFPNRTAQ